MKTQHTPTPWTVSMPSGQTAFNGRRLAVTHNGNMIADLDWNSPQENMGNATFIVKACNCHEELLEACKALVEFWDNGTPVRPGSDVANAVKAAIAKAQE